METGESPNPESLSPISVPAPPPPPPAATAPNAEATPTVAEATPTAVEADADAPAVELPPPPSLPEPPVVEIVAQDTGGAALEEDTTAAAVPEAAPADVGSAPSEVPVDTLVAPFSPLSPSVLTTEGEVDPTEAQTEVPAVPSPTIEPALPSAEVTHPADGAVSTEPAKDTDDGASEDPESHKNSESSKLSSDDDSNSESDSGTNHKKYKGVSFGDNDEESRRPSAAVKEESGHTNQLMAGLTGSTKNNVPIFGGSHASASGIPPPTRRQSYSAFMNDEIAPVPGVDIEDNEADGGRKTLLRCATSIFESAIKAKSVAEIIGMSEENQKLYEECDDETLKRWIESRILFSQAIKKNLSGEYDELATSTLIGEYGFDGLVFNPSLAQTSQVQELLGKKADPNGRKSRNCHTAAHSMAWSATINSAFPESWHMDRLRALRKAGADNRCQVDSYGRTPLMIALERLNVQFVKSMLRVEMGETWALTSLKNVPLFAPGGDLIKQMLISQEELKAHKNAQNVNAPPSAGTSGALARLRSRSANNDDPKLLLRKGIIRPVFRFTEAVMTGYHWAALQNKPDTISFLANLGLRPASIISEDHNSETPLLLAVNSYATEAIDALLRINADIHQANSIGMTPLTYATSINAPAEIIELVTPPNQHKDYSPDKAGIGATTSWDTVGHLAYLLERSVINPDSIEDLCNWYIGLGVESADRECAFWKKT